ncbi:TIM barrel protein [Paraburkholderia xenovorans]|uniref:hydroxypyruvate isomerase family protein n=1 Tax=Paraburkholderia xenovorans TaxID=36873 RepID=UPI0038BDB950
MMASIPVCPNLHFLYTERPFLDRFEAARQDGFRAVELTSPYDFPCGQIVKAAFDAGQKVVSLNAPMGPLVRGVSRGCAAVPGMKKDYREQIELGIEYATGLGCRKLLSLAGIVRDDMDHREIHHTFVENLRWAANRCAAHGITLLIESHNLQDNPNYFLSTVGQCREVIADVKSGNLRMLFDFYHVQVEEGNVVRRFLDNLDIIDHVQIGNPPDRHEPGDGELNYSYIFSSIRASGYSGWIGAEYYPSTPKTSSSLSWLHTCGQAAI